MTATSAPTDFPCGLPPELWGAVVEKLNLGDAVNLSKTCKLMNGLIQNNSSLWGKLYENKFGEGTAKPLKGRILTLQMHLLVDNNLKNGRFYPFLSETINQRVLWMKVGYGPSNDPLNLLRDHEERHSHTIGWDDSPSEYIDEHFQKMRLEDPFPEIFNIGACRHKFFGFDQKFNCMISTTQKAVEWEHDSPFKMEEVPATFLMGLKKGQRLLIDVESVAFAMRGIEQTFAQLPILPTGSITCLAFDNGHFYAAADDQSLKEITITMRSHENKQLMFKHAWSPLTCNTPFEINALVAKGGKLYAGGVNNYLHIWDTVTKKHLAALPLVDEGQETQVITALHANEDKLFVAHTDQKTAHTIKVWNLAPFTFLNQVSWKGESLSATCFTTYGPKLFSGHTDGKIRVWGDVNSLKHIATLPAPYGDTELSSLDIKDGVLCANHIDQDVEDDRNLLQIWPLGLSRKEFIKKYKEAHPQMPPKMVRLLENSL